jgi:hypothetical protein
MSSKGWAAATAAVLLGVVTSNAGAQATCTGNPCSVQVTASATVSDILRLTLSSGVANLGSPTEADYDAGHLDAVGPTATIKSNRPWHVDVAGGAGAFSYTGSLTNPNKPASQLLWGTSAGTYGNNMGASSVLTSGASGTGNATQAIYFRTLWLWASDVAGSYSLVVNFTLAAP